MTKNNNHSILFFKIDFVTQTTNCNSINKKVFLEY